VEDLDALAAAPSTASGDLPAAMLSPTVTRAAPPGRGRPKSGGKKKFVADDDE
jgi:hypothetical protein